ncbi:hypothetical protein APV28_3383 [Comamonas testosteroni]|nr:hypothetical protein APV28_3383 [Comamonas testosteroni]
MAIGRHRSGSLSQIKLLVSYLSGLDDSLLLITHTPVDDGSIKV